MVRTRGKKKVPERKNDDQEENVSRKDGRLQRSKGGSKKPTSCPLSSPSSSSASPTPRRSSGSSTSRPSVPKNQRSVEEMRDIFNQAQHVHQINTSLERLNKMIRDMDEIVVYNEIKRNITFALLSPEKSHYTKNLLNFISRFLVRESKKALEKENEEEEEEDPVDESMMDELGLEAVGKDAHSRMTKKKRKDSKQKKAVTRTIVDALLLDVLIPHLTNGSQTVRLNATNVIRKCLDEVEDLEDAVFKKLKQGLMERLSDKSAVIRSSAAKCLHRFQEVSKSGDIVTAAFNFHLKNDPDYDVRSSILLAVEPSKDTMNEIIARTRDIKDTVRKAAFHKLAERVLVKQLTIEQRLLLIKEGLNDRSVAVKRVVEKELIMNWFKSCNNDLVKFLMLLDIQSDPRTIDKLLNILFHSFLASKSESRTKLHDYVDSFSASLLDSRRLLLKQPLTVENCFIWRALAYFLKENETRIQPLIKSAGTVKTEEEAEIDEMLSKIRIPDTADAETGSKEGESRSSIESEAQLSPSKGPTPPKRPKPSEVKDQEVDLLDMVIPQLPHFCSYVKKFAITIDKREYDEDQLMDYDFIYGQLIKILLLLEVGDEAQRTVLLNSIHDIMFLPSLGHKMTDVVQPLMKVLARNVFKNQNDLMRFTEKLTTEVHNQVLEGQEKEVEESVEVEMRQRLLTPAEIRELEQRCAKLIVDIESMKDEIERLIKEGSPETLTAAASAKKELNRLISERDQIERRLYEKMGESVIPLSHSTQTEIPSRPSLTLSDFPQALLKCNQIFAGCLEYGDIRTIDTFIQSHIDNICFPGILCVSDDRVRNVAVKALGLCCIVSCNLARKYFALFLQIINHDNDVVKNTALQAMFDFLCEFGVHEMVRKDESSKKKKKSSSSERTLEGTADIDIPEPELANIEDEDDANEEPVLEEEEMSYDQFLERLIELILNHLSSESESIRFTTVQGTGKLMLLGKVYSPHLLSQLILLWYNPNSTTQIRHFLGVYFPLFAFQDTKFRSSAVGQSAFEECFLETIGAVFEMTRKDPAEFDPHEFEITPAEIENMIVFMTNLMNDDAHVRVLMSLSNRILDFLSKRRTDDFVYKYLFKALSCFIIDAATKRQLKDLRILVSKIEKQVTLLKLPQVSVRRLEKLSEKIDSSLERLREAGNNSQLSLDRTITAENDGDDDDDGTERMEREPNDGEEEDDAAGEEDDDSTSAINYNLLNKSYAADEDATIDTDSDGDEEK